MQQRTFVAAANASRPTLQKAATSAFVQQTRGKKTVDFAGDKEVVYGEITHKHLRTRRWLTAVKRARRLAS